jgi:TRAP-type C4-dicarboxylate transport system substrate-binding protein
MRQTIFALAALAATSTLPLSPALAQDKKPIEFRYATGAPAKTPWVMQLERFQKDVEEESKGAVKINAYIAGQLGNEQDTIQQIARGRIDMGGFSTAAVALVYPELSLLSLPFFFKSVAEQDCTIDMHMSAMATEGLAKKNIRFLGWTEVGTVDVVGKKPYLTPGEVKGLKAASAANKVSAGMWATLGANPNHIGITEISSAFQTGLVDVNATVVTFYLPSGLAKVAPVLSRVAISDAPGIIVMNKAAYDKLGKDEKSALDRAIARRKASQLRQEIRGFENALRDRHVKSGGQMVEATPEQREQWRKMLEPAWPKMVKDVGGGADAFFKQMEKGRAACAKS